MIGKTLSHYKVLEKIGQGGMGEVYRAEDTNLSREVAIKVLPEQFTKDPQRLARFEREAKLLASLNHPNIGQIYGIEEAGHNPPLSPGFFRSFNRIESDGLSPIRWVRLQ
ncbi:MAG: protein kinase [Acidobacteria bacterium]|nr:protein kinase [Acidobacteriota bacterium]